MTDLPKTSPGYCYVILQGAGIVHWERPPRSNFYAFKIPAGMGKAADHYLDTEGPESVDLRELLDTWEKPWSQQVDDDGYEVPMRRGKPVR